MNRHKVVADAEHDNSAEILSTDIGVGCGKLMKLMSSRCSIFYFFSHLCLLGSEMKEQ